MIVFVFFWLFIDNKYAKWAEQSWVAWTGKALREEDEKYPGDGVF